MIHSTTILAIRHRDRAVLAGDGQVTFGQTVVKQRARKIRRLYNDRILAGFAGSAADSFALFGRFESKLEQYRGNLERSAVELAKDWRSDRILRRLEAMLVVLDKTTTFLLSGNGDLIEPDDGVVAIGSGGPYALAAAKAMQDEGLCEKVKISGLGVPSEMLSYTMNGCAPEFALWSFVYLGYLSYYTAYALASGAIEAAEGASFKAGRMGDYTITKDPTRDAGLRILR